RMFASLLPKSAPFFEMLLAQNSHLRHMSRLLLAMLEDLSKMDEAHKEIALIEEEADKLHVRIIRDLSQTFITPIDREDILRINQEQEEALDGLHTLSTRLHIFEFPTMRFPAVQLVRTICSMLELTGEMLDGLTRREDCHKTRAFRYLRGECDMLLAVGLAELMDDQQEITPARLMNIMKWSQAYDRISMLLENVNNLAETIEEAVLKNV
uniref:DUF47 domain-containing protein n=1 Tax=Desulfovibrio piger TaxID=901 RepID=UPI0026EFE2BB